MYRAIVTLKSGAMITFTCTDFKLQTNPLTHDITGYDFTKPDRRFHIVPGEIAAIEVDEVKEEGNSL